MGAVRETLMPARNSGDNQVPCVGVGLSESLTSKVHHVLDAGSHFMWEWGKPDSTLFSPSHFPLSQSGEPSFLPQEVSCLEEGIQRAAPLLVVLSEPEICCQGWMGHGDLSHSILSILSAPNNVKVVAGSVFPRGIIQEFTASRCHSSLSVLLLQVKKSAKKLQPQSTEPVKRPSQKEKKGRPEEKPRTRSALT